MIASTAPNTFDWKSGGNGAKVAASGGETRTQALYLQDAWRFAPRWTLTLGARAEHWEAFDGFNRDATTTRSRSTTTTSSATTSRPRRR